MKGKEFFINVWNRYTCAGLVLMGIFNAVLLLMRFTAYRSLIPKHGVMYAVDFLLVFGLSFLGAVLDFIQLKRHKKSGSPDSGGK